MGIRQIISFLAAGLILDLLLVGAMLIRFDLLSAPQPSSLSPAVNTVIVLFADADRFSSRTIQRLEAALSLAPPEATIYAVGGARPELQSWGSCEMRNWLMDKGVSADRIEVDTRSFDTRTNMAEVRSFLADPRRHPAIILTDSLHVPRVKWNSPSAPILGLKIVTGMNATLLQGLNRAQAEVIAWIPTLLLPDDLYVRLISYFRANSKPELARDQCELRPSMTETSTEAH